MDFNKLVDIDVACNQSNAYIERAMLIQSDVLTELERVNMENIDQNKAAMLCFTVHRIMVLSEIVFDYLCMMEEKAKQMNELVQEGFKARRQEQKPTT